MYRVVYKTIEMGQNNSIPLEWNAAIKFIKAIGRQYDVVSAFIEKVEK